MRMQNFLAMGLAAAMALPALAQAPAPAAAPAPARPERPEGDAAAAMRAAFASGGLLSITAIIAIAEARYLGRVVEAELEQGGSPARWVYEITFLPPEGGMFEVVLDARDGAMLASEGMVQRRAP